MDFLNQAFGQVRELLLSMTPAARVTAMLLVGVIGVSLGYLFQQQSAGPDDYLFNGEYLPARDVDRAEAAIAQADLNEHERVGNRIRVPHNKKAAYLAAVADAGALPPNFHTLLEDALDLGPFVDRVTRQKRIDAAREQQLSMMIREMDGIEDAKVMYDIRKQQGLSKAREVTATVGVRPTPGEGLSPRRLKMIKKAVAGAIAGLKPADVMVANLGDGSVYSSSAGDPSAEMIEGPYYSTRIAYERLMKANIEDLLRDIPGIRVQVTAELDTILERKTHTRTPEGETAAIRETEQNEESENSRLDNGGRPGLTAQGPTRGGEQVAKATIKNKTTNTSRQSENYVGLKEEKKTEVGLVPNHVRAAIAIPTNYLVQVWREQERKKGNDPDNTQPEETTLTLVGNNVKQKIGQIVALLLPKQEAEDPYSKVEVTFFESLTPDPIEEPSAVTQGLGWASQNFNTLTMAFLAMVSLVMLRSMVKSIPASEPATSFSDATLSLDLGHNEPNETKANQDASPDDPDRPRLKLNKGPSLKDDLTDIVREDPDAAAAILRTWIGNAG